MLFFIFLWSIQCTRADIKPPPTIFSGEVDTGSGSPPRKKSRFYGPIRKLLPILADFGKIIFLAFLKVTYLQIPYWVHFISKVQIPICMFISIEYISNWLGFHFWSETINKACNSLGSQKYYKTLISIEVIIFVTYHWMTICILALELILSKTKIMIFGCNKRKLWTRTRKLNQDKDHIETTHEYKYLGIDFHSHGYF